MPDYGQSGSSGACKSVQRLRLARFQELIKPLHLLQFCVSLHMSALKLDVRIFTSKTDSKINIRWINEFDSSVRNIIYKPSTSVLFLV